MTVAPTSLWPWLTLAGLGFFHGINPAMGWLFAVALGLYRHSRGIVLLSLIPIALGHAASVAVVLIAALALGVVADYSTLNQVAAAILIAWALWHALRGHRQRSRIGMQTGLAGLALWSFLMAGAHGAGLMLIPLLLPICVSASPAHELMASSSVPIALAALGMHSAAMLATTAAVSVVVYEWAGLAFLRTAWVNLDLVWIIALAGCGVILLAA